MTIIPLNYSIKRNLSTGKKIYTNIATGQPTTAKSPKGWNTLSFTHTELPQSYAIRPDNDLIVIDCDSESSTESIDSILIPAAPGEQAHYIVVSDKGEKHFYFKPTDYYRESPLYKTSRVALKDIDVLHGTALVFAPCPLNSTKSVLSGSIAEPTPIPDNIVDYLVTLLTEKSQSPTDSEYSPVTSYLAPTIERALALYGRSKDYRDLENMMMLVTPSEFREQTKPDWHPDRVTEGIAYIQAMNTKLLVDPSINLTLHGELITLITQELWSDPLDPALLREQLSYLPLQNKNGKRFYSYSETATAQPLVSINGNPYMPIYRTLDDQYVIAKPTGSVELIRGISNFKRAVSSKNYSLIVDSKEIPANQIIRATDNLDTVTVSHLAYHPSGVYEEDGSLYYNTYTPTRFLGIIRGDYKADEKYRPGSTPTIDHILSNLMADHGEEMIEKFEQFLAHKLKTLAYSPIVFQMMGKRGVGKGLFMHLMEIITQLTTQIRLDSSNNQFNADTAGKIFVNEDEGIVTAQVVNAIKRLSGSEQTRIEAKGVDAYMARNIATYIVTTNKTTPLAETVTDRRFVMLSSFTANKLEIDNIATKIALEAEQWCLKLRDTKLTNPKIYVDANQWHDEVHREAFRDKSENTEHVPSQIAHLVFTLRDHSGEELMSMLTDALGKGFHYSLTQGTRLNIPLARKTQPERLTDGALITHDITATDLKGVELGQYITEDKNNQIYNKRYYRLVLRLSTKQAEAFSEDIIEGEDIDLD